MSNLFEQLLTSRGLEGEKLKAFLNLDYNASYDPFLLTDMSKAVEHLVAAHSNQQQILIYGDYDVDGITSTALLYDALHQFGFQHVNYLLPHRIKDGYGISNGAIAKIKKLKPDLLVTVDCGSADSTQIKSLITAGIDVIVTDHHQMKAVTPPATAVINPHRPNDKYPFKGLAGVGVAFKLVQALQTKLDGLLPGQEKWLLDLVAIGTVCDGMELVDENRLNTFFGLKVLNKTRRPGLKALVDVSGNSQQLTSTDLGFRLGPRLNAAGRLAKADQALELLIEDDFQKATELAIDLNQLNEQRKSVQNEIFKDIVAQKPDLSVPVLVVVGDNWHEGIIGILASKLMEKYQKPTFVFTNVGDGLLKGSARSFGDFSLAEAIKQLQQLVIKGGGHNEAAGLTLQSDKLDEFRHNIDDYYDSLKLKDQTKFLQGIEDLEVQDYSLLDYELFQDISRLEPFGNGNPEPIFKLPNAKVLEETWLGTDANHLRLTVADKYGNAIKLMSFYASDKHKNQLVDKNVDIWVTLSLNEWNGQQTIEGRIDKLFVS
ncbi:single-stranded-DNA-specific exonuclease RecJ [Candidatus Saccharibacteria bacterium]|nr:single-stranded-DNA-specific exonuclease RecJ [Candidatus Saccharibacteria bacterium]